MSKLILSKLALLHNGICGSFHNKATIHASTLQCVKKSKLGWRQFWQALQKLLLSSHPWPNMNDKCTLWKEINMLLFTVTISWFFCSILSDKDWISVSFFLSYYILSFNVKNGSGKVGVECCKCISEGDHLLVMNGVQLGLGNILKLEVETGRCRLNHGIPHLGGQETKQKLTNMKQAWDGKFLKKEEDDLVREQSNRPRDGCGRGDIWHH